METGKSRRRTSTGSPARACEELFHLAQDRSGMNNLAADPQHATQLEKMRAAYDAELAALRSRVVTEYGYEKYPVLFDRTVPWERKSPLRKALNKSPGPANKNKRS